ncbi:hypothetical protein J2T02_000861 [Chitinophaga terrae (ex Kim and Jung 2007)]|uniref:hypothetical protein n=1 Tax=Chitinophaga terrae (ex Kim and Jung 2007) TaxID=408074 RepID=UPI002782B3E1|nr:hypothetical protein [Chitinophaga terrae (ex Kim and Jung 2007)]MDQ0105768.1 hypothetical protein [Chitinophaga terrae (ex Kim and Jung 2007)]
MIPVYDNTVIYVMCPPQVFTGGPELLHQLAFKLRQFGMNAEMFYYPHSEQPVHVNFVAYNNPYVAEIIDKEENILVVPEVYANHTGQFRQIRKVLWWLSIDNFFKPYRTGKTLSIYQVLTRLGLGQLADTLVLKRKIAGVFDYNLVQSHYAGDFIGKRGIKSYYLSDYLSHAFLEHADKVLIEAKRPQVLYNPKKGLEFTKKIMERSTDLKWIPIQNMTPAQVQNLLKESMVYIDFGNHPGKDRFPREAAVLSCCVITGRKGSAGFDEDVPIPGKYKIPDSEANIHRIIDQIRACLADFKTCLNDFSHYRQVILSEEKKFEQDVKTVFVKQARK